MPGAELGPGVESRAKSSRVPAVLKLIVVGKQDESIK